jgi:hypothetical protein
MTKADTVPETKGSTYTVSNIFAYLITHQKPSTFFLKLLQHHESILKEVAYHSLIRINGPISFDGRGIHLPCGCAPPLCCLRSLDDY